MASLGEDVTTEDETKDVTTEDETKADTFTFKINGNSYETTGSVGCIRLKTRHDVFISLKWELDRENNSIKIFDIDEDDEEKIYLEMDVDGELDFNDLVINDTVHSWIHSAAMEGGRSHNDSAKRWREYSLAFYENRHHSIQYNTYTAVADTFSNKFSNAIIDIDLLCIEEFNHGGKKKSRKKRTRRKKRKSRKKRKKRKTRRKTKRRKTKRRKTKRRKTKRRKTKRRKTKRRKTKRRKTKRNKRS